MNSYRTVIPRVTVHKRGLQDGGVITIINEKGDRR